MSRNIKIVTGLILFAFVTVHLSNLALGVFSLKLADDVRPWLMAPFANPVGGLLLIASMLLHMLLGLHSLYKRNTLRMSRYDTVQFVSALLIPPLLIPHVWGLIATKQMLNLSPTYLDLFRIFWIYSPMDGLRQVLLVVVVWIHGCIGLFTWLELKSWWQRFSAIAYPLAVAIPVAALLGFVAGGNHILANVNNSAVEISTQNITAPTGQPTDQIEVPRTGMQKTPPDRFGEVLSSPESQEVLAFIGKTKWQMIVSYLFLIAFILLARWFRARRSGARVEVRYADGQTITREVGPTLLEISNMHDIPHANLCRGRGRCGTCRVEILHSENELAKPSKIELDTLERTGNSDNVRLACQLSPGRGVISVRRVLPPNIRPVDINRNDNELGSGTDHGSEDASSSEGSTA